MHNESPTQPAPPDDSHALEYLWLRKNHPILWSVTLFGPIVLSISMLAVLSALWGAQYMLRLTGTVLTTFFFFGRFAIVLGATGDAADIGAALRNFSAEKLFLLVLYMDVMVATILSCHVTALFKLPGIGNKMQSLVEDGRFILERHPWMKRATFFGIVAFVMFPLAATGSVGGSIFGRLLGLSRLATFVGVVLGSIMGGGVMYLGASIINRYIPRDNPWVTVGGIATVVLLILILNARYRKMKKLHGQRRGKDTESSALAGQVTERAPK